jgi:hypothetical protein
VKYLTIILVLVLGGCTKREPVSNDASCRSVPRGPVCEMKLSDGTRCAYGYNVGITCDWKPVAVEQEH